MKNTKDYIKEHPFSLCVGILSLSLMISVGSMLAGTATIKTGYFGDMSQKTYGYLYVVPTAGIIIGLLISGFFSYRLGRKHTALLGLSISLVFGVIPAFTESIYALFVLRVLFGVGLGIFTPLSVSMITELYPETKRNKLMGLRRVADVIGYGIMFILAWALTYISFRMTYLVTLTLIIPIVLVIIFVPKELDNYSIQNKDVLDMTAEEIIETDPKDLRLPDLSKIKPRTNSKIIRLALLMFIYYLFYTALALKLPGYIVDNNIGSAKEAEYVFSMLYVCNLFSGFFFRRLALFFKRFTVMFFELTIGVSLFIISFVHSMPQLFVLSTICCFANGIITTSLLTRIVPYSPRNSMNLSSSIVFMGYNLGILIAPFVLGSFSSNYLGQGTSGFVLLYSGIAFILLAVYDVIITKRHNLDL